MFSVVDLGQYWSVVRPVGQQLFTGIIFKVVYVALIYHTEYTM